METEFKDIKGFENYQVTSDGKVWSKRHKKFRKLQKNKDGYMCVNLRSYGVEKHKRVCRLVAEAFIPNPENHPIVNHKNCVRDDDRVENLEWCTYLHNNLHGIENNPELHRGRAEITEEMAHEICKHLEWGLRYQDVAELLGITKDIVAHIACGHTWKVVSKEYTFPPKRSRVTTITAKELLKQLDKGKTYEEVANSSKNKRVTPDLVRLLDNKQIFKEIM